MTPQQPPQAESDATASAWEGLAALSTSMGQLHIERPVPFLVVLRACELHDDERRLVAAEAARWVVDEPVSALRPELERILRALRHHFDEVLLIEVATAAPGQRLGAAGPAELVGTITRQRASFQPHLEDVVADPAAGDPLLEEAQCRELAVTLLRLTVARVWREEDAVAYPLVLRSVRHALSEAIRHAVHHFARHRVGIEAPSPAAFGPRKIGDPVREIDRVIAEIAGSFSFLMDCSPINLQEALAEFSAGGEQRVPSFRYRPLTIDPELGKRRLYATPLEEVDDPALETLLRDQRDYLAEELTMLEHREGKQFMLGSLRLYGAVEDDLLQLARGVPILANDQRDEDEFRIDCYRFCDMAREELGHYEAADDLGCQVSDTVGSLIVDGGVLYVSRTFETSMRRARALIAHEVGTHLVTYLNAREQELVQLRIGLPGFDELQEGLAVLAEYLVGALTPSRLRLLAARVVAVHALVEGADFVEIYRSLVRHAGLGKRLAFSTTARVWRGGGLTKDAVYLRGLVHLLDYFGEGGPLEPLLVGKLAAPHIPLIEELLTRGVIQAPRHMPRHFESEDARERFARLREGASVVDLIDRRAPT